MPKIPTFTTEARPTAEVASTRSNIQMSLSSNIGTALAPITKTITEHAVQEKNLENKAEALSLENNSIMKLNDVIEKASRLDNKDEAYNLIQTESKVIQQEFANQASNKYVKATFNNSFLGEVQKGIFKTNNRVSKNILDTLDNAVSLKKNRLLTEAYVSKDPLALSLVQTDLEKLYEDSYKGRIDTDEYNNLIQNIPGEMQVFEVSQLITSDPRKAYSDLINKNKFIDLDINKRARLIQEVTGVLTPEVRNEWKNYIAAAAVGKEIPFDTKFAKEILNPKEYNGMLKQYDVIKDTISNVSILNSVTNKDLQQNLDVFIKKAYDEMDFIKAQDMETYYKDIVFKRNKALKEDPVNFLNQTNNNIKILVEELNNETNEELRNQKKIALTEIYVQTQKDIGQQDHKIKVMSSSEANYFVEEYKVADAKTRVGMLQMLDNDFGNYNSNAMLELSKNGLPITAELSSFLRSPKETMKFLSLDSEEEQKKLNQYLLDNDMKLSDLRMAVRDELDNFENVVTLGSRFNSSIASDKMDKMVKVLSYYAANELFVGGEESVAKAAEKAASLINGNFEIQDTYFIPKLYDGVDISAKITEPTGIIDKADLIQKHYLEEWGAVAFESGMDSNEEVKITKEYKKQMRYYGEWRNTADGTGLIYGIVLTDGSFGLVKNAKGENLTFKFNDTSKILPGTNIEMDYRKNAVMIDEEIIKTKRF
tara:strand:- start:1332 stop:3458 length:2127 start_codon:yes stop_codon:yes gene_type:complete